MSGTERLAPPRLALLDLHVLVAITDDFFFAISQALTINFFLGWLGVRFGLLHDMDFLLTLPPFL